MNKYATQGRLCIDAIRRKPMTYRQMLNLGLGNSPWKRVAECLRPDEQIIKGRHEPSGCVTWTVRTVR